MWPADWTPLSPPSASIAGSIQPNGNAIAGPFQWTPLIAGSNAILVSVSADGDASNLDSIANPTASDRLLHCDNNAALREAAVAPAFVSNALVNAASFAPGAVSPGEILSIFGAALGPAQPVGMIIDANGNVATQLGSTRVLFNGEAAPLVFVSQSQINVVAPFSLAGQASVNVQVEVSGSLSPAVVLPVVAARPAVFSLLQSGAGQGAVLNQDNSVNGQNNPAAPGTVIQIFATGGGQTAPPALNGRVVPGPQFLLTPPVRVEIGGVNAAVQFAGAAPSLIFGVIQINAVVPPGIAAGNVPLMIFVGPTASQAGITIAVA
jgi:uncharacterized protein (TIGR03437 family)